MSAVNSIFFLPGRILPRSSSQFLPVPALRFPVFVPLLSGLACFLVSPVLIAGARDSDIRVIKSSQQSLIFEYLPSYSTPEVIWSGAEQFTLFDFQGSVIYAGPENFGKPDLRSRTVSVGFPSDAGNAIQVIAADYEEIQGVVVAPVPHLTLREGIPAVGSYETDAEAYSSAGFLPAQVASIVELGPVRSMFIGSVRVSPVQYDPARRTVRKYSRIVIEVVFGSARSARVQGKDDRLLGDVLLNRDVARNWQFAHGAPPLRRGVPSVLANGFWYRIPVTTEGVFIVDELYLRSIGIDPAQVDPRTVKIYGNGGTMVPELISSPRPADLVENSIYVQGESDGVFDPADFLIFYGRPARGWNYNPTTKLFDHYIHHYSETNYYWLTYGGATGKRMAQVGSLIDPSTVVPTSFTGLMSVNEDTINILGSGKDWYGPTINANSSLLYVRPLPGHIAGAARTYRLSFAYRSVATSGTLGIYESGALLRSELLPAIASGDEFTIAKERSVTIVSNTPITGSNSELNLTYTTSDLSGSGWLNWLEIQYPRSFAATGNYLRFRSLDTTGVVEYNLTGFTAAPFILDVTDPANITIVTGATGSYSFKASSTSGSIREYCAVGSGGYVVPPLATFVTNQDLRGITEGYDFIIVTSRDFRSAADRLAAFREQPAHGNLRTLVVDVEQIYNEFSGGLIDITGIRDFLKYALDNWARVPTYALFFGQGSFDYKARFGFRSSQVPTWQSLESRHDIASYASDDFFVRFSATTSQPFLVTGRLNPRTPAESEFLVDKLISYETESVRDPWKLRILIIGDDSWTPEREDLAIHTAQADALAETTVPDEMEKRKIYIAEYPTVITAQGRRKPGAYQAIIDEINQGALIVNFTGHGNPTVWAHEQIFNVQTSIPSLLNQNKLAVFFLATCNFSDFDDPNSYTGSESLLNSTVGGAIGVTSATRKVFAVENFNLNVDIYERMFLFDGFGRAYLDRPATALYRAKVENTNSVNDQKFFYMGDPTMELQYPSGFASIDSINGERVDSVNGVPRPDTDPIQIKALQRVRMAGYRRTDQNLPDTTQNGVVSLVVNDATQVITIPGFPPGATTPFSYNSTGATIYRGASSVVNGKFTPEFIVPKDIVYADSTTRSRIVAYYSDELSDGVGYTGKVYVGGTDTSAFADAAGPTISLFLNSRSFRQGDLVTHEPLLLVDLVDSSGINTSTSGIGHRIEAWLNGSSQSLDITDFYSSELDDFQRGTVQFQLRDLPFGKNSITVRAWDAYNNASTAQTTFEVTSGDQLTISEVMNYPNPFPRDTQFTFKQNQLVPLNIVIRIYTVAGRLIQTLETVSPGEPFIRVPWDGRDRDGDTLANGVYLYKVVVSTVDGAYSSEALGKLSILK